jgi:transcriptional regulator with XRE-family HTH domain
MSRTITTTSHPDLLEDLRLIAGGRHGKGEALKRLLSVAKVTQSALAMKLGVDRSTISHWCSERKWPSSEKMLEALRSLEIDEARLIQLFGNLVQQERLQALLSGSFSGQNASVTMADLVRELDNQNIEDADQRELIVLRALREPILKAMGVKALSDTKAATLILSLLNEAEAHASKYQSNSRAFYRPDPIMRLGSERQRLLDAMDPEECRKWEEKHEAKNGDAD